MRHVMLDLETWGTEPGCDIRSIGAVVFHPDNGTIDRKNAFYVNVENPTIPGEFYPNEKPVRKYPFHRDTNTEKWWSEQSEEARKAFTNPVDLFDGLHEFAEWYLKIGPSEDVTLWCNGPHFDESILKHIYKQIRGSNRRDWHIVAPQGVPWHYRAPRDFRTEMEGAGWPYVEFMGTAHNALDDAIHQARCVIRARQIRPAVVT